MVVGCPQSAEPPTVQAWRRAELDPACETFHQPASAVLHEVCPSASDPTVCRRRLRQMDLGRGAWVTSEKWMAPSCSSIVSEFCQAKSEDCGAIIIYHLWHCCHCPQPNVWVDLAGLSLTTPPKVGTTLLVLDGPGVGQSRQIVSVGPGNASIVLDSALDDWVIPASSTGSHEDLVTAEASKVAVVSSFGSKIFAGNLFNCESHILPARSERSSSDWQCHFPKPSSCFLG
jgi:hypothetical protein